MANCRPPVGDVMRSDEGKLYFDTVKEDRGGFFVEYRPPSPGYRFASLQLVFAEYTEREIVAETMESEARAWLRRYPVAVMVSAFDNTGRLITLNPVKPCDHLLAFLRDAESEPIRTWRLLQDSEPPSKPLNQAYLRRTYSDIPHKTGVELRRDAEKHAKALQIGWLLLFVWLVLVPVAVAILGFASVWVGAAALTYSLLKALVQALKMTGKWPKSAHERQREEEELRMRHHHYHCERNPEAFLKLRAENFENEERERIRQEAQEIKKKMPTNSMHPTS